MVTRVGRMPLASQNVNIKSLSTSKPRLEVTPEVDYKEGDMTIDEIL